ncbi:MAG: tetratricopeptide repeat protein [Verrucomicrobia bacterium]|nr:tetratricopeptide repeat protein [Verrucomicrobiota bacterium]
MPLAAQVAGEGGEPSSSDDLLPGLEEIQSGSSIDAAGNRAKAQAHFATGVSWETQGEPEKALEAFKLSLQADPANTKLAVQVAEKYVGLKKIEEAYQILLPATKQETAPGNAFQLLGLIQMSKGEEESSLESFQQALERDPTLILSRQRLVDVHLRNGEEGPAFLKAQQAVEVTSYEVESITALIGFYLRYVTMRPDRLEDLSPQLESLVVKSKGVAEDQPALGIPISDVLMLMKRFEDAEEMLQDLKSFQPPVPMVREKLVDLFLQQEKRTLAIKELEELTGLNPDNPRPYFLLGSLKADDGLVEEAELHFRKAIAIRPEFEAPYYELAAMKLNDGNAREALKILQEARGHFSDQFILEFYSGLAMSALHRYELSLRFLKQAESIAKKQEPGRLNGFFHFRVGSVLERLGQFEEAEAEFLKCLSKTPDDATTLNYLGYMWAEQGEKLDQAYEWIQKAHELEPESEAILDSMGWILFQQGKPAEALPYLEKAQEKLSEPDPTILDHLADVYEALGKYDKAEEIWTQSLEIEFSEKVFEKWRNLSEKAATNS